jgi:carbonic anhydrase/acetyltransferase-like protein (isoleucine patch superfamily)
VLTENTSVPAGSLVLGVPGKVIRSLRAEELERVHANARSYLELAAAYRAGTLRPAEVGR